MTFDSRFVLAERVLWRGLAAKVVSVVFDADGTHYHLAFDVGGALSKVPADEVRPYAKDGDLLIAR